MKAYLVNPATRCITEVQYTGDVSSLYALHDINAFDSDEFNEHRDAVVSDAEGHMNGAGERHGYFRIAPGHEPIAGIALVIGTAANGAVAAPVITHEALLDSVEFIQSINVQARHFHYTAA